MVLSHQVSTKLSIEIDLADRKLIVYTNRGIAEAGTKQRLAPLKTPCKTQLMREDLISLEGISKADVQVLGDDLKLSDISVETNVEDKFKSLIARSFRAQPLELVALQRDVDSGSESGDRGTAKLPGAEFGLRLRLLFEPLRTFTAKVEVVVICKNRGKWKLQVDIDATDPEPDDLVKMMAAVRDSYPLKLFALF